MKYKVNIIRGNYLNTGVVRLDRNNITRGSPIDKDNYNNYRSLLQAGYYIKDINTDNYRRLLEVFSLRFNYRGNTPEFIIKFHKYIRVVLRGILNKVTRLDILRYNSETDVVVIFNPIIDIGAFIIKNN